MSNRMYRYHALPLHRPSMNEIDRWIFFVRRIISKLNDKCGLFNKQRSDKKLKWFFNKKTIPFLPFHPLNAFLSGKYLQRMEIFIKFSLLRSWPSCEYFSFPRPHKEASPTNTIVIQRSDVSFPIQICQPEY